jgi:hypothetical protein
MSIVEPPQANRTAFGMIAKRYGEIAALEI